MNKEYKILIIGDIDSIYIRNFVKYLKIENPLVHIYYWGLSKNYDMEGSEFKSYLDGYYLFNIHRKFDSLPIVRYFETIQILRRNLKKFVTGKEFDIVNIHFVTGTYLFLYDIIKGLSAKLVLTPWGSDVYRADKYDIFLLKILYSRADFFSGVNNRFTKDVMTIFNVPKEKLCFFDLGSEAIDYILENKSTVDINKAKQLLGIEGKYAITCAYNASPAQQHLQIVSAINKIKNKLPANLILLFPFTYGGNERYKLEIKNYVEKLGLKALYFEKFLNISDLFVLRQSTDIFIHVQTTDANSTSIGEYLLCEKKVINGEWIRYDELENDGIIPYFVAKDLDSLSSTIIEAYATNNSLVTHEVLKLLEEKSCGWNAKKANCSFLKILTN